MRTRFFQFSFGYIGLLKVNISLVDSEYGMGYSEARIGGRGMDTVHFVLYQILITYGMSGYLILWVVVFPILMLLSIWFIQKVVRKLSDTILDYIG